MIPAMKRACNHKNLDSNIFTVNIYVPFLTGTHSHLDKHDIAYSAPFLPAASWDMSYVPGGFRARVIVLHNRMHTQCGAGCDSSSQIQDGGSKDLQW